MKFEFVQDTDLILGSTMYYTKQEGIIISGSFNKDKDEAYEIFMKLSQGIPLRITEVLETKIYQKPSQEE
ncbi:MAG: hypothetical protein AN484_09445 [Aphanizomenon flos-aquae WA102]|jgi:hypothetical protein|uniref:Uncharacterized protein n=1 Tax=Aphanizomenon flos-aquae WA102 TaxID=1710896 RepID=A0A1B7X3T8_APHFL|nr:MAG: hypothetical protein AN484_09445 [Aphanizomenon flos-aquae WA102]